MYHIVGLLTWCEGDHENEEDEKRDKDKEEKGGSGNGSGNGSDEAMRGWLIALQLMQDDDEDIRDIASHAITLSSRTVLSNSSPTDASVTGMTSSLSETLPMVHGRVLEIMGERVGHVLSWCINSSDPQTLDHHNRNSGSSGSSGTSGTNPSLFPQSVVRTLDEITRLLGALVRYCCIPYI